MTWHCAICGRKLRKPALLIRDGLAIGPKCAAQRGLTMVKLKSDATATEIAAVLAYMKGQI